MQTFLPYASFTESAAVLDNKRLGKQRTENLQIMHALTNPDYPWQNHPAVRMWRGYEYTFLSYQKAICDEWTSHVSVKGLNFIDTCYDKTKLVLSQAFTDDDVDTVLSRMMMPPWFGDENFHRSHRSNLLRKDRPYYEFKFEVDLPDNLEYVWPVPLDD